MLPDYSDIPESTATTSYSWLGAWSTALRRPSVEAYESIIDDPLASLGRAITWLVTASLAAYAVTGLLQAAYFQMAAKPELLRAIATTEGVDPELVSTIINNLWLVIVCMVPLASGAFVIGQLFYTGVLHFALSAFGGQGTYADLVYATAAYTAPLTLIGTLLGIIPCVNILTLPLGIYGLLLHFLAVKSASRLSWGAATASIVIVGMLFLLVAAVLVLAIAGPILKSLPTLPPSLPGGVTL
jgi:hypothetical protein